MSVPLGEDSAAGVVPGALVGVSPFPPGSRYAGLPALTVDLDGVAVRYVDRRFVPPPGRLAAIGEHVVTEGERDDTIAAAELGDPELFWRLADANGVLHPAELTARPGTRLRITLPDGVPGAGDVTS